MRWNRLVAALLVATSSAACFAESPEWSSNRPQPAQLFQGRLFSGQGWWTRFGEPVNSVALANAEASPSDKTGPMPMYGDGSYVYSPGACDYSPPCIWNLWGGYFANPCRCHNHHHCLHRHCGCLAGGCNTCDPCNAGCGAGHHCHLFHKLWGNNCGCGASCSTAASCGCAAPSCAAPSCGAPTCTTAADCGCKPLCCKCRPCHLGNAWRGFMAHWSCGSGCDSCSSPLSCGCTTPTPAAPSSEKQADQNTSLIPFPVPPAL